MNDTFSFTLESPLTKEQINLITDAEFEHTDRIWFDTPKGKHIEFVKAPQWIPVSERLPDREGRYLVTLPLVNGYPWLRILHYGMPDFDEEYRRRCWYETGDYCDIAVDGIVAWMSLPEPYEERREVNETD